MQQKQVINTYHCVCCHHGKWTVMEDTEGCLSLARQVHTLNQLLDIFEKMTERRDD